MEPLKILVLYGGKAATIPRDDLIDWLNSAKLHRSIGRKIDARKVAEMTAHMEGSIDQRVEDMMNWADKAIFLLTPDERSEYGAPNVLEEFGRWVGQKGRRSGLTLRHDDVKVHSNASGLVYVGFKTDPVLECRDRLVAFINDRIPPEEFDRASSGSRQQPINQTTTTTTTGPSFNIGGNVGGGITAGDGNIGGEGNVVGDGNTQNQAGRDVLTGNVIHHHHYPESSGPPPPAGSANGKSTINEKPAEPESSSPKTISVGDFRDFLGNQYSKKELQIACANLGIEFEDFDSGKAGLILDLLGYLRRRNEYGEFIAELAKEPKRLLAAFGQTKNLTIDG